MITNVRLFICCVLHSISFCLGMFDGVRNRKRTINPKNITLCIMLAYNNGFDTGFTFQNQG